MKLHFLNAILLVATVASLSLPADADIRIFRNGQEAVWKSPEPEVAPVPEQAPATEEVLVEPVPIIIPQVEPEVSIHGIDQAFEINPDFAAPTEEVIVDAPLEEFKRDINGLQNTVKTLAIMIIFIFFILIWIIIRQARKED